MAGEIRLAETQALFSKVAVKSLPQTATCSGRIEEFAIRKALLAFFDRLNTRYRQGTIFHGPDHGHMLACKTLDAILVGNWND